MKFFYIGRNNKGEKVSGLTENINKKDAVIQLKKDNITITKIEPYNENKGVNKLLSKLNLSPKMKRTTKKEITTKELKSKLTTTLFNFKNKVGINKNKYTNKSNNIIINVNQQSPIEKSLSSMSKTNKKFNVDNINEALQASELFEQLKSFDSKQTKNELEGINVDVIMNSDFKDNLDDFVIEKEQKKSLLTSEFDINTLKKILNSDIGGNAKKDASGIKRTRSKKVKQREILMYCKKMATLLETGIPITRALQLLMQQAESEYFQKILGVVTKDVSQGMALSISMAKFPKVFTPHFTALIKTGEDTGELAKTFELLHKELMDSEKLKSKVKAASMYPCCILFVLFVAFIVSAKILVPMFNSLFEGMGLPPFSKAVFAFLTFFDKNLLWIVLSIFGIVAFLKFLLKNLSIRYRFDVLKLKIPVIGQVITQYHIINILRTLDIALKNGLSIIDSLELAIQTTSNIAYKFELQKVVNKVIQGVSLSQSMEESAVFPLLCTQMLKIGEESGKMNELIERTLEYYDWTLNDFIDKVSKLIEPVAIIFVAIFVVMFVFAVAMPMFDLSSGATLQ